MKALVIKELKSVFCSLIGAFFALAFLIIMGTMLWGFIGRYNFIDRGYASMQSFFSLAPVLFSVLIPALTMRQFSEEKRNKTFNILLSRPVTVFQIYVSKFLASFIFCLITLLASITYVYSLYQLANPIGNIDILSILASYFSLILLISVFIVIGLFASSLTKNQVVALIFSVFICLFSFYGFQLLGSLFLLGKTESIVSSIGLLYHYELMQRGVIQIKDLLTIFNYIFIFSAIVIFVLSKRRKSIVWISIIFLFLFNVLFLLVPNLQFDFTRDKRYTLNVYTKELLKEISERQQPLKVNVWLDGDLNSGFQYLQDATRNILDDFNRHSNNSVVVEYKNPYQYFQSVQQMYEIMAENGMGGILLNEVDREGKSSQKMIYPYAQVINGSDTLIVPLLKNLKGNTADENINISAEGLEFEFVDAIRLLNQSKPKNIAFIEGHGEISRAYIYDAEELLSKYYFVNRGQIGDQVGVLNNFDVIIIAGPVQKYNEGEKYIIDQYIMSGGKVLWLIDGAYYEHDDLVSKGYSASMKNETNLDDLLFSYGVRVNPDFIQDRQCSSIYLVMGNNNQSSTTLPCFYIPQLIPSQDNIITKDIRDVRVPFISSIDVVNNTPDIYKSILLTSSGDTHVMKVPETINFDISEIQEEKDYFNQSYIPVAISMDGIFNSAFNNRMMPEELRTAGYNRLEKSVHTRMIVVGASSVIRNDIEGMGDNSQVLPMGYDRVTQQQFGNREFIVNAINWLTDDEGWMQMRKKQQQLYILNKKEAFEERNYYTILNIGVPILFVVFIMGGISLYRKNKYQK